MIKKGPLGDDWEIPVKCRSEPPWRYFAFCYASMFVLLVVGASRGMFVEEKDGAGMLLFLAFAPLTLPLVILLGVAYGALKAIFWLGSIL